MAIARTGSPSDDVDVYDSLYSVLPTSTKECIAGIVFTSNEAFNLRFMDVQRQSNGSDCGLHAIAVLTALLHGVKLYTCIASAENRKKDLQWWHVSPVVNGFMRDVKMFRT